MAGFRKAKFECQSSIDSLCGTVAPGGGRVLACLQKNKHRIVVPECSKLVNALK
ncbi:MAG: cysteine rich repeat-containing protein [Desulfobulbia bacterium]